MLAIHDSFRESRVFAVCMLSVAATLATCAANSREVRNDYTLQKGSGKGIVIVSISHKEGFIAYPPTCRYGALAGPLGGTTVQMAGLSAASDKAIFYSTTVKNSLGRPAILGRVNVIELPVGDYRFGRCASQGAMLETRSTDGFVLPFSVLDGQAVYLGSIRIDPDLPDERAYLTIEDQHQRDLEIVRNVWPGIDLSQVETILMRFEPAFE